MTKQENFLKIVEWSEDEQCFIGRLLGYPMTPVRGKDEVRVYSELCEAATAFIEGQKASEHVEERSYSGKLNLRVGEELHELLAIHALRSNESLNSYCVRLLREALGLVH